MKKRHYILLGLTVILIGAGVQTYAITMADVAGTYSIDTKDRLWIQGEGTLRDYTHGTITINANNTFVAYVDGYRYTGDCRVKRRKFVIERTAQFLNQLKNYGIKPWVADYVAAQGGTLSNFSATFSKYKIPKAKMIRNRPKKLKIILHGTARGYVAGWGSFARKFKFQTVVNF